MSVRFTAEEKATIAEASRYGGYKGMSKWIRRAVLMAAFTEISKGRRRK